MTDDRQQGANELAREAMAAAERARQRGNAVTELRDLRRHPVSQLLRTLRFDVPTAAELDQLQLPPAQRRKVAEACRAVVDDRVGGNFQAARQRAHDSAAEIVGGLPPDQRCSDYLDEPDSNDNDPRALADGVSRLGG